MFAVEPSCGRTILRIVQPAWKVHARGEFDRDFRVVEASKRSGPGHGEPSRAIPFGRSGRPFAFGGEGAERMRLKMGFILRVGKKARPADDPVERDLSGQSIGPRAVR